MRIPWAVCAVCVVLGAPLVAHHSFGDYYLESDSVEIEGMIVEFRLPQAGQSPSGTYEGDGYVILRDPDTARVEHALSRLVSLIRVELG